MFTPPIGVTEIRTQVTMTKTKKPTEDNTVNETQDKIVDYLTVHGARSTSEIQKAISKARSTTTDNLKALEASGTIVHLDGRWTTKETTVMPTKTSSKPKAPAKEKAAKKSVPEGTQGSRGNRALAGERDAKVLTYIKSHPASTTAAIAEAQGMTHDLAYLSIWRLLKRKQITKSKTQGETVSYTVS